MNQNKKIKYLIIRELIKSAKPEDIMEIVINFGLVDDYTNDYIEIARKQLISYLDKTILNGNESFINADDLQITKAKISR